MPDAQIELILLLTGLATSSALALFLAPVTMMKILFGQATSETISLLIARHWGLLIFLVGALLVYAAYHPEIRLPTLMVALVEKVAFALGVFLSPLRRRRTAVIMAVADASMAAVYIKIMASL